MKNKIYIYDNIGIDGIRAKKINSHLNIFEAQPVDILINSAGGEVYEGLAIHNAIFNYKGKTTVYIEGIVYGIAYIIALAADKIMMHKKAYIGLADPFIISFKTTQVERELVIKARQTLISILSKKLKISADFALTMLENEVWYNAKDSIANNMVDEIYEEYIY